MLKHVEMVLHAITGNIMKVLTREEFAKQFTDSERIRKLASELERFHQVDGQAEIDAMIDREYKAYVASSAS